MDDYTQPENYWYAIVYGKLIWAVLYPLKDNSSIILFLDENGFDFESLDYPWEKSKEALSINGFTQYIEDEEVKKHIYLPSSPFRKADSITDAMIFFKEAWMEPPLGDGTTPKTDWDANHSNNGRLPFNLLRYLPILKYALWTLTLAFAVTGYAYFTGPDGLVVTIEGEIEGSFNNVRAFVQNDVFWKAQHALVNKSILINQTALASGEYDDFQYLKGFENEDEPFSTNDIVSTIESIIFGEYYDEIKNNSDIIVLRSKAKLLHEEADDLEEEASQIALKIFNELSTKKTIADLLTIKSQIEIKLQSP